MWQLNMFGSASRGVEMQVCPRLSVARRMRRVWYICFLTCMTSRVKVVERS